MGRKMKFTIPEDKRDYWESHLTQTYPELTGKVRVADMVENHELELELPAVFSHGGDTHRFLVFTDHYVADTWFTGGRVMGAEVTFVDLLDHFKLDTGSIPIEGEHADYILRSLRGRIAGTTVRVEKDFTADMAALRM